MSRRIKAVLILATVILGGSTAVRAEHARMSVAPQRPPTRARHQVPSAFLQRLQSLWERAGSYIDPFGNQSQSTPPPGGSTPASDAGSYIDPFGHH